jgi:general nucleoside transport system permease protein
MSARSQKLSQAWSEILSGNLTRTFLAILLGFAVGAAFMIFSNREFIESTEYFFARPLDSLGAAWSTVSSAYGGLFKGAIFNASAADTILQFKPLSQTVRFATPLIIAGLGISVAFRSGLFNIGGTGQIIFGMIAAITVATRVEAPPVIHLLLAIVAAVIASSIWGGLVGYLKARTGAHEVILTIMFNYVAIAIFSFLLRTEGLLLQEAGGGTPKADPPMQTALFPLVFGEAFSIHWGVLLAVVALVFYWWLMEKSNIGFRLKMVGYNPAAAEASGVSVRRVTILTMLLSASFMGFVGANQVLGNTGGATVSSHVGIGFDAITVALLGGSSAPGIMLAGLLFGAFKAGNPAMQLAGVSPDVLTIVQASIVLFIAAPPLVRAIFRLPRKSERIAPSESSSGSLKQGAQD